MSAVPDCLIEQGTREAVVQLRATIGFVSTAAQLARVSAYLLQAEIDEGDPWYQQDYRLAGLMVGMAEEGRCPSYENAFLELFGKASREVVGWWRDRRKLLFLAHDGNCPTPLLLANRAHDLLLNRDLIEIPDHGWVPEGTMPWPRSVPYVGEYHPSEELPAQPEPKAGPRGVCILCAKPLCAGSKIHCHYHYRQNGKASKRCRQRKAAQGICQNCRQPAIPGSQYCEAHRQRHNAAQRASWHRMQEHPELRRPSRKAEQAAYMRGYRAGRREQSVCMSCGEPTTGSYCAECRRKNALAQQRCSSAKLAVGRCRHCSRPVCSQSKFFCRIHRAKQNARNREAMRRRRLLKQAQKAAAA